ncbi:MAG: hypothetical protein IAE91_03580 [Ignavibacteriaceae bacterium]|nr:hypothetical protein [Ignavibacteriaceae bacterium]
MGEVVYYTIIRLAVLIPLIWFTKPLLDERWWFVISIFLIHAIIIYPAYRGYKKFVERSKKEIEGTLCSICKHYEPTAMLCKIHDKHPSAQFIPCDGHDWEVDLSEKNP